MSLLYMLTAPAGGCYLWAAFYLDFDDCLAMGSLFREGQYFELCRLTATGYNGPNVKLRTVGTEHLNNRALGL